MGYTQTFIPEKIQVSDSVAVLKLSVSGSGKK